MAESRKSYTIRFQPRDQEVKAIIQWLESYSKSDQKDLILRAVKLLYSCYVGKSQELSEPKLLERFHLHKAQVDDHFYKVCINLFGEEKAGSLNHYFSEKREPTFGQHSPTKSSITSETHLDDDDDLYGEGIDEDLGDEVSI